MFAPVAIARDLERGQGAGAPQVLDLVVALVVQARDVHPPLDVAAAVRPRRAHVLAHRQRHGTSGAVDLVRDLRTGGRRTDDHDAARLQALGVAVLGGGQLRDAGRNLVRELRYLRDVERAGGQHDRLALPGALLGDDLKAVAGAADGSDRAVRPQRRRHPLCVALDERDRLGHRPEAVRIVALVAVTRQPALPVRREQRERIPALGAPGVGDLAALEDDMVDRALGEPPAHGQPGLARADDDGGRAHRARRLCRERLYATSTVTLVGLVMMS